MTSKILQQMKCFLFYQFLKGLTLPMLAGYDVVSHPVTQ